MHYSEKTTDWPFLILPSEFRKFNKRNENANGNDSRIKNLNDS